MATLRLSGRAEADLRNLLAVSRELVGAAGEARYATMLAKALAQIAGAPEGPTTRARADLGPGLRSVHTRHARRGTGVRDPVHVIYYRIDRAGTVEVLAVLHERMDPRQHVPPAPGKRAPARRGGRG